MRISFPQLLIVSLLQFGGINAHVTLLSYKINLSNSMVGQIQVISVLQTQGELKRKSSISKIPLWSGKYGFILVILNVLQLLSI